MRFILALVIGLFAGSALATNFSDVDNAKQIIAELKALQSTRDVTANQVTDVTITANVTAGGPAGGTYTFKFKPTDTGWNGLLSSINTAIVGRISALKTQLQGMDITNVPN